MVDSSDFEAFYAQEREKASRVLPPSSYSVMHSGPSRHLFFARRDEEELFASSSPASKVDKESESTLNADTVFALPQPFIGNRNNEVETFRKNGLENSDEANRGINSTQRKKAHNGSQSTFFESPYWPGQHEFKSKGLLDSNSTFHNSQANGTEEGRHG